MKTCAAVTDYCLCEVHGLQLFRFCDTSNHISLVVMVQDHDSYITCLLLESYWHYMGSLIRPFPSAPSEVRFPDHWRNLKRLTTALFFAVKAPGYSLRSSGFTHVSAENISTNRIRCVTEHFPLNRYQKAKRGDAPGQKKNAIPNSSNCEKRFNGFFRLALRSSKKGRSRRTKRSSKRRISISKQTLEPRRKNVFLLHLLLTGLQRGKDQLKEIKDSQIQYICGKEPELAPKSLRNDGITTNVSPRTVLEPSKSDVAKSKKSSVLPGPCKSSINSGLSGSVFHKTQVVPVKASFATNLNTRVIASQTRHLLCGGADDGTSGATSETTSEASSEPTVEGAVEPTTVPIVGATVEPIIRATSELKKETLEEERKRFLTFMEKVSSELLPEEYLIKKPKLNFDKEVLAKIVSKRLREIASNGHKLKKIRLYLQGNYVRCGYTDLMHAQDLLEKFSAALDEERLPENLEIWIPYIIPLIQFYREATSADGVSPEFSDEVPYLDISLLADPPLLSRWVKNTVKTEPLSRHVYLKQHRGNQIQDVVRALPDRNPPDEDYQLYHLYSIEWFSVKDEITTIYAVCPGPDLSGEGEYIPDIPDAVDRICLHYARNPRRHRRPFPASLLTRAITGGSMQRELGIRRLESQPGPSAEPIEGSWGPPFQRKQTDRKRPWLNGSEL